MTTAILEIIGLVLLLFGRKLFWLSVGVIGFLVGISLGEQLFPQFTDTVLLIVGVCLGVVGALLAILIQKIAIGTAGFFAGGFFTQNLASHFQFTFGPKMEWLPFLLGGIVGAIILVWVFEFALIILSSLVGAFLLVRELNAPDDLEMIFFIVLAAGGMVIQFRKSKKQESKSQESEKE